MLFSELLALANSIYDRIMTPTEKAKALGTYGALDRSKQYAETSPRELLRAVNEAWAKIRTCEKTLCQRDAEIAALKQKLERSKTINALLTFGVIGLWELAKFLVQLQLK